MEYKIIGVFKREYHNGEYPTKFYLHTMQYPHIIQVSEQVYNGIVEKSIDNLNLPFLKITEYQGEYYFKYSGKGEN